MFEATFVFLLGALTIINAQNRCSEENFNCINIHNCSEIVTILKGSRPLSVRAWETLNNSHCGFDGKDPMVCCNQQQTTETETITTESPENEPSPPDVTNHPNLRLLDHFRCGPIVQRRVFNGNKTGVLQYPWMAILAYDTGRPNPEFRCGGSIINSRYVLTAAHCVTTLPSTLRLVSVRVGEHDISKERDCEKGSEGEDVLCAEKYQDFEIESVTFHPNYTRTLLQNDIALIRLNGTIDFTPRNVKPICLPFGSATQLTHERAIVTGWGATEIGPRSRDLLQAKLPIMKNEQCKEVYKRTAKIWYKQLCAGGEAHTDSCMGDSGGPLQASAKYNGKAVRYVQYGVVSYGLTRCGTTGVPGVYTKVSHYMDWILDSITN
ncbi:hypothetical protein PUN28_019556 [Cardiocondyla obscurior]|uniref:CLIP domain-containing serine protease n=1 Tax=Cardiocondyla obscurior TaxID=286306 RepID=A0AAW2EB31_9HYME